VTCCVLVPQYSDASRHALLVPAVAGVMLKGGRSTLVWRTRRRWAIGPSQARRLDVVRGRHKPSRIRAVRVRPSRTSGGRATADDPQRERHCGQELVRQGDEPRAAPPQLGETLWITHRILTRPARDQPRRVNVRLQSSQRGELIGREWRGCPAHP
jgi:hypothetical protein